MSEANRFEFDFDLKQFLDFERNQPDIPSGQIFDAWRVKNLSPDQFADLTNPEQMCYLSMYGLLAPSSHNSVVARFKMGQMAECLEIWADRSAILPFSDPKGRQAMIGLGATEEAIRQVALANGLLTYRVRLLGNVEARCIPIMSLQFEASGAPNKHARELMLAIPQRKVVRADMDGSELPSQLIKSLGRFSSQYPGVSLTLVTDPVDKFVIAKYQQTAEGRALQKAGFLPELGTHFHPNDSQSPTGMRGREFGLEDNYAKRISQGLSGAVQLGPEELAGFSQGSRIWFENSSALGIISASIDDGEHRLMTGRLFMGLALKLQIAGYRTSVHAALSEMEVDNQMLRSRLRLKARPELIFRIGRVKDPLDELRPHSARPSISEVFLA